MRILLAIDNSDFSKAAKQVLITQIRPNDVQVLIVHAIEPPAFFEQDASLQERYNRQEKFLTTVAEELSGAGFNDIETRVIASETREGILQTAAQWHADLIMLGSHGLKGLQKLMLGSVAESVTRHAPCSVVIVRTPTGHRHEASWGPNHNGF